MASPRAQQLCHAHIFWALIRRRVDPGDPLFAAVNRRNFNSSLKAAMEQLRVPDDPLYSSQGFRRGATHELEETGPPWPEAATSGARNSSACRGCVDMSRDMEMAAHQLFDVDTDSASEQECLTCGRFVGYEFLGNPLAGRHGRLSRGFRGFRADDGEILGKSWRLNRLRNAQLLRLGILGGDLGALIPTALRPRLFLGRKDSHPSLFV